MLYALSQHVAAGSSNSTYPPSGDELQQPRFSARGDRVEDAVRKVT